MKGNPKIQRLFSDFRPTEQDYVTCTGIYPITHAVAVRKDLIKVHPELPAAVFRAFSKAKFIEYKALKQNWYLENTPWVSRELETTTALMGDNFFPYGIAPNRKTPETFFRYSHEHRLASRRLTIEEVFDPSTLERAET